MRYSLLLLLSCLSFASLADSFPDEPYISVTGSASLAVDADQVIINFQPNALNHQGEVAKKQVDAQVATVISRLKNAGFSSDLIKSVSQASRPEYDYTNKKRNLLGVRVTHELSYRLTDISKVNQFLDVLLTAQVESISPLQYGLQNPSQWQQKVRQMAVLDSKQKAEDMAQLYEADLGKVYSINYQSNDVQPVYMRSLAIESDAISVKPKNITLNDRVSTVFILKP
ncbi:hypothetical protein CW745_06320 [Psychromonas sp. psych-6C06]|uniref:SIMPL domain-containing protein n=1 Tax=Psychromonas sp. psych-6C06 TaxID=2058089 RepID=UPI000C3444A4|nr:SIMPL domain-containing protein [Psychromonas sp. psych-6C06]PKF63036.1 hypothetical protein CW745_06320 [Psychromonas sp. psych-6C06]